jgi:2-dehydrotetronate isomerase
MFHRQFTGLSTGSAADERFFRTLQFYDNNQPMPRLSANLTFLFNEVPFLDRFAEAARAGFRAVEFAFAYDVPEQTIAARLAEHGLECVLINAPPGDYAAGERGLAALPGREDEFAASFATALRYAGALRCPRIHVMAGVIAASERRPEARATFVANLRIACEAAHEQGVTVTIEALNARDVPNYLFSTQADAHAFREAVGAPNIKAQMDFYHTQIAEGDLAWKLERWLPHIGHIQIAGTPGRHEPDVGEINYAWLLRRADELGYDGWVGCEYRPLTTTLAGLSWRDRLLL